MYWVCVIPGMAAAQVQSQFRGLKDDLKSQAETYVSATNNIRHATSTEASTPAVTEIPTIDIGSAVEGNGDVQGIVDAIRDASKRVGFFIIKNHGIPQELIDEALAQSKSFFDLPQEEKDALNNKVDGVFKFRGTSATTSHIRGDHHEAFLAGPDHTHALTKEWYGPNKFPRKELLPEFEPFYRDYMNTFLKLAKIMEGLFALSLDMPKDCFAPHLKNKDVLLRLNHYPQQKAFTDFHGHHPHTDFDFFTLLVQNDEPGLQVLNQANQWIQVTPSPGSIVVNVGDHLEREFSSFI